MHRIIAAIICFAVSISSSALSDTDKDCIRTYNGTLNNDILLGEWYRTYKWSDRGAVSTHECVKFVFTKPSEEELQKYKNFYNDPDKAFNLDDNALLYDHGGHFNGLITGLNEVKYKLKPYNATDVCRPTCGYNAWMFRRVNDEHYMYLECDLRSSTIWLFSRKSRQSVEELKVVIAGIPEVKRMKSQRFCDGSLDGWGNKKV